MQLISKYKKGIRYLLCAVDLFSKYAFVLPLKDKKGSTIVHAFQTILNKSKRKPNKIWLIRVVKCSQHIMKESLLLLNDLLQL